MLVKDFNRVVKDQVQTCLNTLVHKASEYATEDRLHNFKIAGNLQGVSSKVALAGMMAKHTVSIYDMVYSHREFPVELWEEKITDHINYLLLLKAMIHEG